MGTVVKAASVVLIGKERMLTLEEVMMRLGRGMTVLRRIRSHEFTSFKLGNASYAAKNDLADCVIKREEEMLKLVQSDSYSPSNWNKDSSGCS